MIALAKTHEYVLERGNTLTFEIDNRST